MKFFVNRIEEIIGTVSLAIMTTIAFINVLTRYFFRFSMAFTEELTLYLFVWAVMMGTSIAFREGSNMAVTFLYEKFSFRSRKILDLFAGILGLFFFAVLMYFSILEVMDEIEMNALTEAIELPMWWFTGAMPVASAFILFRIVSRIRKTLYTPPVE